MPARKLKKRLPYRGISKKSQKKVGVKSVILFSLTSIFVVFCILLVGILNTNTKIILAIKSDDGNVIVSVFDPEISEITNVTVPSQVEVSAARNLGTWKISSLWQLGQNEGLGGNLLQDTIIKNFHFPITNWADSSASGFSAGGIKPLVRALFLPYKTNLSLAEKIRLAFLSLKVSAGRKLEVNLADTTFLRKKKLTDGSQGYIIGGAFSEKLAIHFSDNEISQVGPTVLVRNVSDKKIDITDLGATIEILGAKVVSEISDKPEDYDCLVFAKKNDFASIFARVFRCKVGTGAPNGNFDIELRVGKGFYTRF